MADLIGPERSSGPVVTKGTGTPDPRRTVLRTRNADAPRSYTRVDCGSVNSIGSISVLSSFDTRTLLIRFDTGQ